MADIKNLNLKELETVITSWGFPRFCAGQVFDWVYKKSAVDFSQMSNLPLDLRKRLAENYVLSCLELVKKQQSKDKTEKFLFELADKNFIEAVSIPAKDRVTGCISSQAGCKFACRFCASGQLGLRRNLEVAEIIEQALYLKNYSAAKKLTHIVFMGTGEPLDNYDNVLAAIRLINAKDGMGIGARRITISTCGIIPGIEKLAQEKLQIELSVSLHAADNATRDKLMPVNKKYPLEQLLRCCRDYVKKTNRQVTFEYILVKDINSGLPDARRLAIMLAGFDCKVNLIPANPARNLGILAPPAGAVKVFQNALSQSGVKVTLRQARGEDIDAACGQLRLKYEPRCKSE